uniref:uncharacterized protein LOC104266375 n=1 Tax=Ciona intestinalis TaxID=7719 RepID=UPI00089DB8A7|nr:uncharacterized protein LOC104266375 [Ciona intestinalis]XP_026693176.1 uncharacterized protein LOC104266375 [Ciona intestinalis]|eukprot:XP_009860675.2 uncharacterized protein LOC104266375 [Ciona intestinalis]
MREMSLTKKQKEEEKHLQHVMEALEQDNVEKIKNAISTKKHGKGFVLTSKFSKKKRPNSKDQRRSPQMPVVVGSPFGSPPPSRKSSPSPSRGRHLIEKTYITETDHDHKNNRDLPKKVDMASQFEEVAIETIPEPPPGTPEPKTASKEDPGITEAPEEVPVIPEYKEEKEEQVKEEVKKNRKKGRRISSANYARLALSQTPTYYKLETKLNKINKEENPAPVRTNVFETRVKKEGGNAVSPFYTQLEIPEGALRSDVLVKFVTQDYKGMEISLGQDDKLCSHVVDIGMAHAAYSLHKDATLRMRILGECVNVYDDVIILCTRHFQWERVPTRVETKKHNGDNHLYAVTNTQFLGKFVVITSPRVDRFVLTSAGDLIRSTIDPDVALHLEEATIGHLDHLVELYVRRMREDAVVNTGTSNVNGIDGRLVASSSIISVTKQSMGKTPSLQHGVTLPTKVTLTVPVTTVSHQKAPESWTSLKVMHKFGDGEWSDITLQQNLLPSPKSAQSGNSVSVTVTVPCQLMVLAFSEKEKAQRDIEIEELCEELVWNNRMFDVKVLVHQKVERPEIISVHIVPKEAAELISKAMEQNQEWKKTEDKSNEGIRLAERDHVIMRLRDGLKLTINQISPKIQFNSRRWQGFEYQLEATEESFANISEAITGSIEFYHVDGDITDGSLLHSSDITIPREKAKPYKPTVVVRPVPKVQVFREYKLKWMKNLSASEQEKYKSINTP